MTEPTKTIVYTCPYVPAEWIAAHGWRPRRLIPLPVEDVPAIPRIEGLCPYARAFANEAAADSEAGGVIVTTLCDQMRRIFELLARATDTPAFLLNVPSTWQTVAAQRLYIEEFKRLSRFLVRLGGHEPIGGELSRIMLDYDDARQHAALPVRTDGVPIAVVGGPLMQRDRVLSEIVEECGGRIVLDATETGQRGRCRSFDRRSLAQDPLLELAQAYFEIPDASRRPNSELYRWLQRELTRAGARGIIFHHYVWCDLWRAELARLKEWTPLPVLGLDSDGHGDADTARSHTRLRAFLEMLQ
jgi:benzoyl-CoA reductase/2-hydroxyglutaryl-CoA dehydratase subunit BcrC/BadD/HgdB